MTYAPPPQAFYGAGGVGRIKGICRDERMEPQECAKEELCRSKAELSVCCMLRAILTVDITNGKIVLAFLFVCRMTEALKSTLCASPNTRQRLQMEKSEVSLPHERKERGGEREKRKSHPESRQPCRSSEI